MSARGFFITGTDTGVGKTIATAAIGIFLQDAGMDVGVMKPVQCAGTDARFLKKTLRLADPLALINPCYAREPLSPHLAFARERKSVSVQQIQKAYAKLSSVHQLMLVEGAGGLLVPLRKGYYVADLIRDLDLRVIIIARMGLGTINHTLLTVRQSKDLGLDVAGVIFNEGRFSKKGLPEQTNPGVIRQLSGVRVLGIIPSLKKKDRATLQGQCEKRFTLKDFLRNQKSNAHLTQRYQAWDQQYLWHPFTQMRDWLKEDPLIIERARGNILIDTRGRRYLDGVSSLWVNVHGHGHPRINAAVKAQVNRLSHSTLLGLSNTPAVTLAKQLVDIAPKGLCKVFYSDNGSTSVEIAVKMAYQYWQNTGRPEKKLIAHLANSYHGDTLGSVSIGGIKLFHDVYRKLIFKSLGVPFPDCYRAPKGKKYPAYAFEHVRRFEQVLKKKHKTIAALVAEPIVQGAAGMIVWPQGVLKALRDLCGKYNVVFIADEVATGFGRTGKMFACEHENVSPDILCLAKGLTGGYLPLAATLTTQRIFDGFCFDYKEQKTFFHGHTYTGNPLCCAAALANLEVFRKEKTLTRLRPKIKFLSQRLKMFYNLPHVGDVRQKGFMAGIELVRDRNTKEPYAWQEKIGVQVCLAARKKGVILRPLGNVIVLMPPLAITLQELQQLVETAYQAIEQVTQSMRCATASGMRQGT